MRLKAPHLPQDGLRSGRARGRFFRRPHTPNMVLVWSFAPGGAEAFLEAEQGL